MIEDLRVENMGLLRDEFGSVTALSARLRRSDSQVSQWINASINSGTGQPRGMKPKTARWIEESVGKPKGWLDQDHSADTGYSSPSKNTPANSAPTSEADPVVEDLRQLALLQPYLAEAMRLDIKSALLRAKQGIPPDQPNNRPPPQKESHSG